MNVRQKAIKEVTVRVFQEKDGSWAASCSELGVYATGKDRNDVRKNFAEALALHLSVIREHALAAVASLA